MNEENPEVRVIVGETRTARTTLVVSNSGSEPAFDAKLKVVSGFDLPPPRGFNCQNQTVNDTSQETRKASQVEHYKRSGQFFLAYWDIRYTV